VGSRRDTLLLVLLVALILGLALVASARESKEGGGTFDPRTSTWVAGPHGTRALHDVLGELGIRTGRRTEPFTAGRIDGPLVILAPTFPLDGDEAHAVAKWVRGGGTLIYAVRRTDGLRDTLGLGLSPLKGDSLFEEAHDSGARAMAAVLPVTDGVAFVDGFRRGFTPSPALLHATVLAAAGQVPTVVDYRLGDGRVIAWADALPLTNEQLRTSRAAILFARTAADAAGGKTLWFDEYHHGFKSGGSTIGTVARFLAHEPAGHAVLQGAAVVALLLLLLGRRFGAPLPPPPTRRRSPLEHVDALAGAYRQAEAKDTARRLLIAGLARRLGRRVPPTVQAESELLGRLAGHPTAAPAARELQTEWKKGRGADLVALSRDVDRYLDEVSRT
jgi:hypothetical protein